MGFLSLLTSKFTVTLVLIVVGLIALAVVARNWSCRKRPDPRPYVVVGEVKRAIGGNQFEMSWRRRRNHIVTLEGVGVPAAGQPYSTESRESLERMIGGKQVTVTCKRDRWWRDDVSEEELIGSLVEGQNLEGIVKAPEGWTVNEEQIRAGMAWCTGDQWKSAELQARAERRGLWQLYKECEQ